MLSYELLYLSSLLLVPVIYFIAAYLIYHGYNSGRPKSKASRIRNLNFEKLLVSEQLEDRFKESGYPFKITGKRYQFSRYIILFLFILGNGADIYTKWSVMSAPSILLSIMWPVTFMMVTNTKASPVTYILKQWKEVYDGEKNREFFMVYNMISDEMSGSGGGEINLRTYLDKVKDYTVNIHASLVMGLRVYDDGADIAMAAIAKDIGTPEAEEVSKLIADLESMGNASDITRLIESRDESYRHLLRENRRKRRKFFGSLAYTIALSPVLMYLFNALNIAQKYAGDMTRLTNLN